MAEPTPTPTPSRLDLLLTLGIPVLFFIATAPTLSWLPFSSGSENLVVATVLELKRSAPPHAPQPSTWLLPTLQGEPRTAKPPLATWLHTSLVDSATVQRINGPNDSAYFDLAWQFRWPALLCACLTLAATYELGRLAGGTPLAICAALAHGSTYLFLRFSRPATTDVQLALWVTAANVFLAHAILTPRRWLPLLSAAACLALAFMSKGPVALAQSLLPAAAFVLWRRLVHPSSLLSHPSTRRWAPISAATFLFLSLALPWFLYVALHPPVGLDIWTHWKQEVLRKDATQLPPDHPLSYLALLPMTFPWLIFFIGGLLVGGRALAHHTRRRPLHDPLLSLGVALNFFLLLVPILIMTLIRDRKERYLLPMLGPASVLIAAALLDHVRSWKARRDKAPSPSLHPSPPWLENLAVIAHWSILGVVAILLPLAGATTLIPNMKTIAGSPWYAWALAIACALIAAALLATGVLLHRRRPAILVPITVALMLLIQTLFLRGYMTSPDVQPDMRPLAEALSGIPGDPLHYGHRPGRRPPEELAIYLNRTIIAATDVPNLPRTDHPQVLVIYQHKRDPAPATPDGWTPITHLQRKNDIWHAYLRPGGNSDIER